MESNVHGRGKFVGYIQTNRAIQKNRCPYDCDAVLEENATTLFLTDMMRGMSLTFKVFFEKKVTVSFATPLCAPFKDIFDI